MLLPDKQENNSFQVRTNGLHELSLTEMMSIGTKREETLNPRKQNQSKFTAKKVAPRTATTANGLTSHRNALEMTTTITRSALEITEDDHPTAHLKSPPQSCRRTLEITTTITPQRT